ncbi:MAG: hypothetical protein ACJ74H_03920 [Thermoanaerobaculia bacterium]
MLAPTPRERLLDPQGRPYFLWDVEMTLDEFESAVRDDSSPARPYLIAKVMRQAKPTTDLWPAIERHLGKSRAFWTWLLEQWEQRGSSSGKGAPASRAG